MATIERYARVFGVQLRNNFVREIIYRSNFLTMVAVDLIWIGIEFSLFTIIYGNVDQLGGWKKEQVYFFLGIFFASDAIFTTFFQRNFWQFTDLVTKGELDILLTKPVHPVFMALTRWFNLTAIFNLGLGLFIAVRYATPAGFAGGWHWLAVAPWLLFGVAAATALRFVTAVSVFWMGRSYALSGLYYRLFQLATKPDVIYPRLLRYAILTAIPFAFIASVPTRALLNGLTLGEVAAATGVLALFIALDVALWHLGMKRYQSASS